MTREDLRIEVPATLPGESGDTPTGGAWIVAQCREKLEEKYGLLDPSGTRLSYEFDSYVAERSRDGAWSNRMEGADLAATRLMHSNVSDDEIDAFLRAAEGPAGINAALADIEDRPLANVGPTDPVWTRVEELLSRMTVGGVGLAKMTKLLCMKRPRLVPMLDSLVLSSLYFTPSKWPRELASDPYCTAGVKAMKRFRELLLYGNNRDVLAVLSITINEELSGRGGNRVPVHLDEVRLLESLLWFDRGGYLNFRGRWVKRGETVVLV